MPVPTWTSIYIFHGLPFEPLLERAVGPFVETCMDRGWASDWFFVRYGEDGPHIRLRIKGDASFLKREASAWFSKYLSRHPSDRPPWMDESQLGARPNNSLHFPPYHPETSRYGGRRGLAIAEKQFCLSSQTVLSVLKDCGTWDYAKALGIAVQLHLVGARAFGLSAAALGPFFSAFTNYWISRAGEPDPETPREQQNGAVEHRFEALYKTQVPLLKATLQDLWNQKRPGSKDPDWLQSWHRGMVTIGEAFRSAMKDGALHYPISPHFQRKFPTFTSLDAVHLSLLHMTNNRLGILNGDEAYMGYLLSKLVAAFQSELGEPMA